MMLKQFGRYFTLLQAKYDKKSSESSVSPSIDYDNKISTSAIDQISLLLEGS